LLKVEKHSHSFFLVLLQDPAMVALEKAFMAECVCVYLLFVVLMARKEPSRWWHYFSLSITPHRLVLPAKTFTIMTPRRARFFPATPSWDAFSLREMAFLLV